MSAEYPNVLVTGFSVFPGAPINPTELLVKALRLDMAGYAGKCRFDARVLEVDFATIGDQLAAIALEFEPDIALHFGLADEARGFRFERFGRNMSATDRPDNSGGYSMGVMVVGGAERFESTLPREQIASALDDAGLPASLDDKAGDYLCNAAFYLSRSGQCGAFRPTISGFIHVPQLPIEEGGMEGAGMCLPFGDLVRGAKIAIDICVAEWRQKKAAG